MSNFVDWFLLIVLTNILIDVGIDISSSQVSRIVTSKPSCYLWLMFNNTLNNSHNFMQSQPTQS